MPMLMRQKRPSIYFPNLVVFDFQLNKNYYLSNRPTTETADAGRGYQVSKRLSRGSYSVLIFVS